MKARHALTLLVVGMVLAACAAPLPPPGTTPSTNVDLAAPRTAQAGSIEVTAHWAGPQAGPVFALAMDTHTVDLDQMTLVEAVLRNDRAQQLTAAVWTAPAGGHHRSGELTFAADEAFFEGARWIELVLPALDANQDATLRWEI
jgi:hypothetical protein